MGGEVEVAAAGPLVGAAGAGIVVEVGAASLECQSHFCEEMEGAADVVGCCNLHQGIQHIVS